MSEKGTRPVLTRRMAIMSGAVTVLVLAAVVFLIMALGAPRRPSDDATRAQAATYIDQANSALESGNTTLAASFAAKAVELDSGNAAAVAVVRKVREAQKKASASAGSGSSGSGTGSASETPTSDAPNPEAPPIDDSAFEKKIASKVILLPTQFAGFSLGDAAVTDAEAQVSATPEAAKSSAKQIIWTVHEMGSAAKAQAFVDKTSKELYSKDAKTVTVDGASTYVGTDGTRYATASYVRGIYVFEILIAGDVDPAQNLGLAVDAALAFGDSTK